MSLSTLHIQFGIVAGSAGRNLKRKTGRQLPRITGLDPASKN